MAIALLALETLQEGIDFLSDLLSEQELERVIKRWQVIKHLLNGEPQRKIQGVTGASSYMVARVNRNVIKRGTGMAKAIWERLNAGVLERYEDQRRHSNLFHRIFRVGASLVECMRYTICIIGYNFGQPSACRKRA